MRLKILLTFAATLLGYAVMAQTTVKSNGSEFYQRLIIELGVDKDIPIFYKTSLTTLKRVDLTNEKLRWEGKEDVPGMTTFLHQFNTHQLSEHELLPKVDGHPFITKKYESVNLREQPFLEFSPIIYSIDKKLALCSVYHWSSTEAASETIYILRLEPAGWRIVKSLLVSIS